jgi:hypothetical protein
VVVYELLREAVLAKKQVTAIYDGYERQFCPHALGSKNGEAHCLAYQWGGESRTGRLAVGSSHGWRCFVVARLSQVTLHEGEWYSCETRGGLSPCLDHPDVEAPV